MRCLGTGTATGADAGPAPSHPHLRLPGSRGRPLPPERTAFGLLAPAVGAAEPPWWRRGERWKSFARALRLGAHRRHRSRERLRRHLVCDESGEEGQGRAKAHGRLREPRDGHRGGQVVRLGTRQSCERPPRDVAQRKKSTAQHTDDISAAMLTWRAFGRNKGSRKMGSLRMPGVSQAPPLRLLGFVTLLACSKVAGKAIPWWKARHDCATRCSAAAKRPVCAAFDVPSARLPRRGMGCPRARPCPRVGRSRTEPVRPRAGIQPTSRDFTGGAPPRRVRPGHAATSR